MKRVTILLGFLPILLLTIPISAADPTPPATATAPTSAPASEPAPPMSLIEATSLFSRLYAQDLKKAATSGNLADSTKLAAQMLNSAKTSAIDQPTLLTLLCSHAYDLGIKSPQGYATAAEAIELLAEKVPETRVASLDKATQVRQLAYNQSTKTTRQEAAAQLADSLLALADAKLAANDFAGLGIPARRAIGIAAAENLPNKIDIKNRANILTAKEQVATRLQGLLTRLKTRPEDAAARNEIVATYLAEFDNPAEAARYLDPSVEETLRKFVPLAVQKPADLNEPAALELADGYLALSDKASDTARPPLLIRAKACYAQYLALHKTKDASRTTAEMALKKLETLVPSATQPDSAAEAPWIDLFKLETPGKSSGWDFKEGTLTSQENGRPIHVIPVVPEGSYDLLVKFSSQFGNGDNLTVIYLPVGNGATVLCLSGDSSTLSDIKFKAQNETSVRPGGLTSGQRITLAIRVSLAGENADITIRMNDTPFIHWKGPQSDLSTNPPWGKGIKTFAVGTYYARSQFDTFKLRMLTGQAKLPEKADPPPKHP